MGRTRTTTRKTKAKKPFYKKWWVWILVIGLLGSCGGDKEETTGKTGNFESVQEATASNDIQVEQADLEEVPVIVEPEEPDVVPVDEIPIESEPTTEDASVETQTPVDDTPIESQPTVEENPELVPPIEETPIVEEPVYEEPVAEEPIGTDYVLNTNSKKFHYTWCDSVDQMSEKNKAFHTGTRDEVVAMGYKACKNCNP